MSKLKGNQNARKPESEKRTAMIKVMVTERKKARIKATAKSVGLTMTDYLLEGK